MNRVLMVAGNFDVEAARREYARPDGIVYVGGYDFGDYVPMDQPAPIIPVPWPFNLGPNGAFLVLLVMEAPLLIAALVKWLSD